MVDVYRDSGLSCDAVGLTIRRYYFPWGSKRVRFDEVRSLQRVQLSALRGGARIWGTANPRYWVNLDVKRPTKTVGLILDVGKWVRPFVTPDDPDALEAIIREGARLEPGATTRGPLV
jgi:hypothetical protein